MNEQLQQALAAMLNKAVAGVDAGAAFLQAEIPDVVYQLLLWKACVSVVSMLGFLVVLYVIYRVNKIQLDHWKKAFIDDGDDFTNHPEIILNLLQLFWFIPLSALFSLDWLQIWVAPKIYIIEYAASLAK